VTGGPAGGRWLSVHGRAAAVASTAARMSWVAASGWDTNDTCEAATSTIVAFARSAMNRCNAGGIALSWVPSKYQHGYVFQAGGPDAAVANAGAAYGRWVAAITAAVSASTSAAKASPNASGSKNRSVPSLPSAAV
jgi:hypothetical protein